MSDVPFQHPGSVPPRPEVPEGVVPGPPPPAPAPPRPADETTFAWWAPLAAFVVAFVGVGLVVAMAIVFLEAAGAGIDAADPPPAVTIPGTLLQDFALVGLAVVFAGLGGSRLLSAWSFGFRPARFWISVGLAAAAALTFYAFAFVWSILVGITESDDLAKELGAKDSTLSLVGVSLLVLIAAPLTEEFFFRGFCFPALSNRLGWVWGAIATGFFFGIIHIFGTDIQFIPPLMVFGFLLCLLYRFTGSILPCIALHAFNNGVALSVTLEWEPWQIALTMLMAPLLCLAVAVPLARRGRPALAADG